MSKVLGEAVEMIAFLIIILGGVGLFSVFWNDTYQLHRSEQRIESFFDDVERMQSIDKQEYEKLCSDILELQEGYELAIELIRQKEVILQEELREVLHKTGNFPVFGGDALRIVLSKRGRKRSFLQRILRW